MMDMLVNTFVLPQFLIMFVLSFAKILQAHNAPGAENENDLLLCRQCGHQITAANNLINVPSPLAVSYWNDTILDTPEVLVQLFQNPHGNRFEVIVVDKAGVYNQGQAVYKDTWFPGHTWKIAICPRCGHHMGWTFEAIDDDVDDTGKKKNAFIGLILSHLLHKDYVDSLLIVPKAFKNR